MEMEPDERECSCDSLPAVSVIAYELTMILKLCYARSYYYDGVTHRS